MKAVRRFFNEARPQITDTVVVRQGSTLTKDHLAAGFFDLKVCGDGILDAVGVNCVIEVDTDARVVALGDPTRNKWFSGKFEVGM